MSLFAKLKPFVIGAPKDPYDKGIFHRLSLIAFFAWIGLGADGLSSSCYGPEEAFLSLGEHRYLSLFVALAVALTVFLISASYAHIIEQFPAGGGGYVVASKLLSPKLGMVSGCALLVDYVLTISISVASGSDALFSFLPANWHHFKLPFALTGVMALTVLNLRGVKESVIPLIPIFLTFLLTHLGAILYTVAFHIPELPILAKTAKNELLNSHLELGWLGTFFILMKAYSMGAGTYTGIEAVSNGVSILREPQVQTGKRTMLYMAISLAVTSAGLILAYLLFNVSATHGKTLNAVLFEAMTARWGKIGDIVVWITLFSEAMLLFVAAQAGFIDGPRVLANMSLDRWFPVRFAALSDRLVTQNGIIWMGMIAFIAMLLTRGSVKLLVVLYSINVFITFCLSQAGMVRHWWTSREPGWKYKGLINGTGFLLCAFILVSMVVLKFFEGGWVTVFITGVLVWIALSIRKEYEKTDHQLKHLNSLVEVAHSVIPQSSMSAPFNHQDKTAVVLVNGYNGLGLHTLLNIMRLFGHEFKNFVFLEVGIINAASFKGVNEIRNLKQSIALEVDRYVEFMTQQGYHAEGIVCYGLGVVEEVKKYIQGINQKYPNAVFFGGQLVFPEETWIERWLHNYTIFALQRVFYKKGVPFVILPIRVIDPQAACAEPSPL